jgi:hypothetical protein
VIPVSNPFYREEKDTDAIYVYLELALTVVRTITVGDDDSDIDEPSFLCKLSGHGTFKLLIIIMGKYVSDEEKIKKILFLIYFIIFHQKHIQILIVKNYKKDKGTCRAA